MRLICSLRQIRGKRKIAEIADQSGVNKGTLSMIERGRMLPLDEHIAPLEQAYGAPLADWYDKRALLAMQIDDEAA